MRYIKKYNKYLRESFSENDLFLLNKEELIEYFSKRVDDFKNGVGIYFLDYEFELCPLKIKKEYIDLCIEYGYGIYKENMIYIKNSIQRNKYIISSNVFNHNKLDNYEFEKLSDELKSFYISRLLKYNKNNKQKNELSLTQEQFDLCSQDIIKNFFPSIYNLEGDKEEQIKNKDILPKKIKIILIENVFKTKNKLLVSIIIEDSNGVNECIDNLSKGKCSKIVENNITFTYNPSYEVISLKHTLDFWSERRLYSVSYLEENFPEINYSIIYNKLIKEYYLVNKDSLKNKIGGYSLEAFINHYYDDFFDDEDLKQEVDNLIVSKTSDKYEEECNDIIKSFNKYIKINPSNNNINKYDVTLNNEYFIEYIKDNNIQNIEDINLTIIDYIETYCPDYSDNDVYTTYNTDLSYSELKYIDNFFEKKFNETEITSEQKESINKYNYIEEKYFKKNIFENKFLYIKLFFYDIEEMKVNVLIKMKKSNKSYKGFIDLERLISYINHEDLFD